MKYKVKLIFLYTDTVEVEADNKKDAVDKATDNCEEQYECFYDAEVSEIQE